MTDNRNQNISGEIPSNDINKKTPKVALKNLNRDIPDAIDDQIGTIAIINHNLIPDKLRSGLNSSNSTRTYTSFNDSYLKRKEKKMDNINLVDSNKLFNTEKKKSIYKNQSENPKPKKLSNIMKMKTFSSDKEKSKECHNIVLPLINQNENNDKSKKKIYCLKKLNTIISQNPLELSFGDSQLPDSVNDTENTFDHKCRRNSLMVAQRNFSHDSKQWYYNNTVFNKTNDFNKDNNTFNKTCLKKNRSKNSHVYKKIHTIYDNTKDKNHKYVVKFDSNENDKELSPANLEV